MRLRRVQSRVGNVALFSRPESDETVHAWQQVSEGSGWTAAAFVSGASCVVCLVHLWRDDTDTDPTATAQALRDGWLFTGDLGIVSVDGFLTLKDRSKDMIISGGSNIYPREVEEVLLLHPKVLEVSIIGRKHADWGEEVVAYVVSRDGATIDKSELDQVCLDHIARFKRPKEYIFIEALPKNNYGKVLKTELRSRNDLMISE